MRSGTDLHLVQVLLPLRDDEGRLFAQALYDDLEHELTERFGGITSYSRSPAKGRWKDDTTTEQDDIVVIEIMAEGLDRDYWRHLRARLEQDFRQDEIVIRAQPIERL